MALATGIIDIRGFVMRRSLFTPFGASVLLSRQRAFSVGSWTLWSEAGVPECFTTSMERNRNAKPKTLSWKVTDAPHLCAGGNAAAEQWQHDVYGEILDCAYQWAAHGGEIDAILWAKLKVLVEAAQSEWNKPDHGIWEVRTAGRPFTYSAAMCQVALDRGARLARRFKLQGNTTAWQAASTEIRNAILEEAWDDRVKSLIEHLGGGGLDASLLSLPLRRVIPADHPKMVATAAAIAERLSAGNGLLYRYLPEESPDGLPGHEGAFLLCSFWMVDNLAHQGRIDEAMEIYQSLCRRAGSLGLLPEQIDPGSGAFLGNYPQGFSHIGVISSGVNLPDG